MMGAAEIHILGGAGARAGAWLLWRILEEWEGMARPEGDADYPRTRLTNAPWLGVGLDGCTRGLDREGLGRELVGMEGGVLAVACVSAQREVMGMLPKGGGGPDMVCALSLCEEWLRGRPGAEVWCSRGLRYGGLLPKGARLPEGEREELVDSAIAGLAVGRWDGVGRLLDVARETASNGGLLIACSDLSPVLGGLADGEKIEDAMNLLARETARKAWVGRIGGNGGVR